MAIKQLGRSPAASTERDDACYSSAGLADSNFIFSRASFRRLPGGCDENMRVLVGGRILTKETADLQGASLNLTASALVIYIFNWGVRVPAGPAAEH